MALSQCKRFAHQLADAPIDDEMLELSAQMIAKVRTSEEGQEGTRAFLEKRPANWNKA